jgi:hypothetical protein
MADLKSAHGNWDDPAENIFELNFAAKGSRIDEDVSNRIY